MAAGRNAARGVHVRPEGAPGGARAVGRPRRPVARCARRVQRHVVDDKGNAYVGNFGFHYAGGRQPPTADLALVRPDGSVSVAAPGLRFPNGSVITPNGRTLIVGETFGGGYEAFTIHQDATLGERRRWADLLGCGPDGCTLDAEGAITRDRSRCRPRNPRRRRSLKDMRLRRTGGTPRTWTVPSSERPWLGPAGSSAAEALWSPRLWLLRSPASWAGRGLPGW